MQTERVSVAETTLSRLKWLLPQRQVLSLRKRIRTSIHRERRNMGPRERRLCLSLRLASTTSFDLYASCPKPNRLEQSMAKTRRARDYLRRARSAQRTQNFLQLRTTKRYSFILAPWPQIRNIKSVVVRK